MLLASCRTALLRIETPPRPGNHRRGQTPSVQRASTPGHPAVNQLSSVGSRLRWSLALSCVHSPATGGLSRWYPEVLPPVLAPRRLLVIEVARPPNPHRTPG